MTPETRTPIDAYLDAVDLALLRGQTPRTRRTAIINDLESHIIDALRERAAEPTADDISALLSTLGPPESYANGVAPSAPAAPFAPARRPWPVVPAHAKWAFLLLATGYIGVAVLLANFGGPYRHVANPSDFLLLMIASTPIVILIALSSVLGYLALRTINRNPLTHWGRPLAVLEILAFPCFLCLASPILFIAIAFGALLAFSLRRFQQFRTTAQQFFASA